MVLNRILIHFFFIHLMTMHVEPTVVIKGQQELLASPRLAQLEFDFAFPVFSLVCFD